MDWRADTSQPLDHRRLPPRERSDVHAVRHLSRDEVVRRLKGIQTVI